MESNSAAENLQVIRTLMERSALYRRALAPILLLVGGIGVLAALVGVWLRIGPLRHFAAFWLGTAVVAISGAFLIARRQALKDREAFWSPPTRRVTQALALPLAAGLGFSLVISFLGQEHMRPLFVFPNILFYACAVHSAGFFMPRGMRLFAWLLIILAVAALLVIPRFQTDPNYRLDHLTMGFFFGALHLAHGIFLFATEKGTSAA